MAIPQDTLVLQPTCLGTSSRTVLKQHVMLHGVHTCHTVPCGQANECRHVFAYQRCMGNHACWQLAAWVGGLYAAALFLQVPSLPTPAHTQVVMLVGLRYGNGSIQYQLSVTTTQERQLWVPPACRVSPRLLWCVCCTFQAPPV